MVSTMIRTGQRGGTESKATWLPPAGEPARLGRLVAVSQKMREVLSQLAALAASDLPVLIEGGPGAGKHLAAVTLCEIGAWSRFPSLEINLEGPGLLFDQELLEAGALARRSRGTLILKSVETLSSERQRTLVQLMDEIAPQETGTRLRVIATSGRELRAEVLRGRFRADLYYRLRGALLRIPSLAERSEDLPVLIAHFIQELGFESAGGRPATELCAEATRAWSGCSWSANIRELKARLGLWLVASGPEGKPTVLKEALNMAPTSSDWRAVAERPSGLRDYRRREERALVMEALEGTRWNVSAAARSLGLSRVGLSKKMKVLGLARPSG